jgi:signal peptidase II
MIPQPTPTAEPHKLLNERLTLKSFVLFFLVAAGIAIDQCVKYLVFSKDKLPMGLIHFRNYQFAFSIAMPVWLIYVLYIFVLVAAFYYLVKRFGAAGKIELLGWALLLAGGLSNVGERIFLGYVRDYLVIFNGIFNLADLFIIAGILILLCFYGQ